MGPDRVELVVIGESLDSGHFSYGEVAGSTSGVYGVVAAAWSMHTCSDRLGLGVKAARFMASVTRGSSDGVVPIRAVGFSEGLEGVTYRSGGSLHGCLDWQ